MSNTQTLKTGTETEMDTEMETETEKKWNRILIKKLKFPKLAFLKNLDFRRKTRTLVDSIYNSCDAFDQISQ